MSIWWTWRESNPRPELLLLGFVSTIPSSQTTGSASCHRERLWCNWRGLEPRYPLQLLPRFFAFRSSGCWPARPEPFPMAPQTAPEGLRYYIQISYMTLALSCSYRVTFSVLLKDFQSTSVKIRTSTLFRYFFPVVCHQRCLLLFQLPRQYPQTLGALLVSQGAVLVEAIALAVRATSHNFFLNARGSRSGGILCLSANSTAFRSSASRCRRWAEM